MNLWTKEHALSLIPAILVMLIITIILRIFLIKKSLKVRMIPFQIITIILLTIEVGKQIYSIVHYGYDLYHIPLHFCSLFLFVMPFMSFYNGKYKEEARTVCCTTMTALLMFMLIYPDLIYSADNIKNFFKGYIDFHTVFFHNIVLFAFFIMIGLDLHKPTKNKKEVLAVTIFIVAYVLVASIMSQVIKVNFSNFYHCNVGPIASLIENLKASCGNVLIQTLYVVVLGILHVLFVLAMYYLFRLIIRIKTILIKNK